MIQPGCLAEFSTAEALLKAVRALRERNYRRLDAYTPFPVEGLDEALGLSRSWIDWMVFPLAFGGAGVGYLIQWYVNGISYPLNVGGRNLYAWPAWIPITFETGVLVGGVGTFVLFFLLARLPRLWQPIFDVEGFASASIDRYWLAIDRREVSPLPERELALLTDLGASRVALVGDGGTHP
jgi:hypothetical protein